MQCDCGDVQASGEEDLEHLQVDKDGLFETGLDREEQVTVEVLFGGADESALFQVVEVNHSQNLIGCLDRGQLGLAGLRGVKVL